MPTAQEAAEQEAPVKSQGSSANLDWLVILLGALAGLGVPVAAVVFDEEVVDAVPHDSHDQPVDAVITPAGFFRVGGTAGAVRASNAHGPFRTD